MRISSFAGLGLALVLCGAAPALAETSAIPDYGRFTPIPAAHEQPDPAIDYKVIFDVSQGAKAADAVSPGLDRAARLVNMLAAGGVPAEKRHLVVVVHGPATDAIASDAAYAERHDGMKNPNTPLIAALRDAGVSIRVCGQAMLARKLTPETLADGVQIDLAALMTVAHTQLQGYALVSN